MKSENLKFNKKYKPLFDLLHCWDKLDKDPENEYYNKLKKVDTVLISGGRDSGKSFALSCFNIVASLDFNHRILFTRQTMSSTNNSINKAVEERLKLLEVEHLYGYANQEYFVKDGPGLITITGQKTSVGTDTAKLKSIENYSIFETDEGEELKTFYDWNKIKRSMRAKDVQCLSIISFNPPTTEHWIYPQFYENVPSGFNGIIDNILYIHTTYLDNGKKNMAEHNWLEYEDLRINYELYENTQKDERELLANQVKRKHNEYKYSILGGFKNRAEGVIYEDWITKDFDYSLPYIFGLDFGSNDPDALTRVAINHDTNEIYIKEEYFKNNTSFENLAKVIEDRVGFSDLIVADSSGKRLIDDLYEMGFNIKKCRKGDGSVSAGIKLIQSYTLCIDSKSLNLHKALNNYVWHDSKAGAPKHDWSDLCDSFRYAIMDLIGHQNNSIQW